MLESVHKAVATLAVALLLGLAPAARAADWQPPKDGLVTDKQVTSYLAVLKDYMQAIKAAGKAIQGTSGLAAGGVLAATDDRFKASLAAHGLTQAEFNWVANQVMQAKASLMLDDIAAKATGEMNDRLKKLAGEQAAWKQKIADGEKALKEGRRIMTPEDRANAIKSAQDDQKSADDDAKSHMDAAKEAADAAAKSEAAAKAASALAAKPPPDVSADDRANYIADRKKEAEDALAAAKESRDKETEEKKATSEAQAKSAAAAARAKSPDVPVTDEERANAKTAAEEMLTQAKSELQSAQETDKLLREAAANMNKEAAKRDPAAVKNAEIVKPHVKEFDEILGGLGR